MSFHTELFHSVQLFVPQINHLRIPDTSRLRASYPATMTNDQSNKHANLEKRILWILGVTALISELLSTFIRRANGSTKAGDFFFNVGVTSIVLFLSCLILGNLDQQSMKVVHSKGWFLYVVFGVWLPQTTWVVLFHFYTWPYAFITFFATYGFVRWLTPYQSRKLGRHRFGMGPLRIREQAVGEESSD